MTHDALVSIYEATHSWQVENVRQALAAVGITSHVDGGSQAGYVGVLPIHLLVRESDASAARQVLENLAGGAHAPGHMADDDESSDPDTDDGEADDSSDGDGDD